MSLDEKLEQGMDAVNIPPDGMWRHKCPVEGSIFTGKGEECPWCGTREN